MSKEKYLLGFDLGTQGSKGVITDVDGRILAYDYKAHEIIHEKPDWAEHDAEETWWGDFVSITRNLLTQAGILPEMIVAIGISGVFPCIVPVDRQCRPLYRAILYSIDSRCEEEIAYLNDKVTPQRIWEISRKQLSMQSPVPKILWLRNHMPEVFENTEKFLPTVSYLVAKLTGEYVVDYSTANELTPLYDYEKRGWNSDLCEIVGIRKEQLPKIMGATDIAGGITEEASRVTGLCKGIPVIVGTGDFLAEALSTGAGYGDTFLTYGSTMQIFHVTKEPVYKDGFSTLQYPVENLFLVGGGTSTSASITKWFRDEFCAEELNIERRRNVNAYEQLSKAAANVKPGAEGLILLPYFAGERSPIYDPKARGMVLGLTLSHTKAHIYRAILEGTSYSIRHHLEILRKCGMDFHGLISTGGGIKSDTWTQILSDVTGEKQLCFSNKMGAPAGDAYMAGMGVGIFENLDVLRTKWIAGTWMVEPNLKNKEIYDAGYRIYRKLYECNKDAMHKLAGVS